MLKRFIFLSLAALAFVMAKADNDVSAELAAQNTPNGWQAVDLPVLPAITSANTFNITSYGASTSSLDNTAAIQAALNAVPTTGGMVVIPEGTWLCGPIVVKSKTIVHISKNATLRLLPFGGTTEANKANCYPSNGKNSSGLFNYDVFMSNGSTSINDVIVEGEGTTSVIDGQGKVWWDNYKSLGTRPSLIRFKKGTRYLFRNFKLLNSPGTNLTLGGSGNASHFTVHDVTISAPSSEASSPSHNTDGIPIWGPYVNIYNCDISTGDDNIVVDSDGHHIHAWNIKCGYGHGMSIGSYTSRVHDVIYEDITFNNTGSGFRIKSAAGRSGNNSVGSNGAVSNIICRNATMTGVAGPIKITSWYDSDDSNPANVSTPSTVTETTPEFCDILFQNITANAVSGATSWKHACPVYIYGRPEMYIHDIILDNVKINSKVGMFLAYCKDIIFKNGCKVVNEASSSKTINVQYQNTILGKYDGTSSQYDGTKNPSYGIIEETPTTNDSFWTFDTGYNASYTANATVNGLNIVAASDKEITVNANNKTYTDANETLSFTYRLQFGGSGSTASRNVNFPVSGPCTIEVWAVSGKTDTPRDLMISDGTNATPLLTTGNDIAKGTYQYNGSGGKIYIYSANSGINLYGIRVKYTSGGGSVTPVIPSVRTFTDFSIDFTTNPYSVKLPSTGKLPSDVVVEGVYHNEHGYRNSKVTFNVDGPVKITIGGCNFTNTATIYSGSTLLETLDTKAAGCSGTVEYYYWGGAATLTADLDSYCPSFKAEAVNAVPKSYTISYVNGTSKTDKTVYENTSLSLPADPAVSSSKIFLGWNTKADGTGVQATATLIPVADMTFYAVIKTITLSNGYVVVGNSNSNILNGLDLLAAIKYANAKSSASNPVKIFLKNATYDIGTNIKTEVKGAYVSLIGESRNGVLIVNHPVAAGMNNTETLYTTGTDIYLQDIQIRCDVSYSNSVASGVGVAIQVRGDKSIFKNVDLQGNQDTYLSSGNASQRGYFVDGRIEGTVDYICGGGNIWFENTLLYNNKRSNGDVIAAPSTSGDTAYGYVFYNCTVDGDASTQANKWNFARGWKDCAAATWINTKCLINPSAQGYTNMTSGLAVRFHEYNTTNANGVAITGHNLNGLGYSSSSDAIYLSSIGKYTYDNVVKGSDNWDAAAIASQVKPVDVSINGTTLTWSGSAPAYLIEDANGFVAITTEKTYNVSNAKGTYTVRAANGRGGFGTAVEAEQNSPKGTLLYTASVQGGSNAAGQFINEEKHYYNNWGSPSWAAQAYIGFSVELPAGKQIKSATLSFTSYCGGNYDGRKIDVYCLDAQQTKAFNVNAMSLSTSTGTLVGSVTDNRTESLKTLDATTVIKNTTNAVKSTKTTSTSTIIFQLGGAAAGGFLYGKNTAKAPTLLLEFEDFVPVKGDVNADERTDISDVTTLINIILDRTEDIHGTADVNGDTKIDIFDITTLVDILLDE